MSTTTTLVFEPSSLTKPRAQSLSQMRQPLSPRDPSVCPVPHRSIIGRIFKLRPSRLHRKHLTDWAIFPVTRVSWFLAYISLSMCLHVFLCIFSDMDSFCLSSPKARGHTHDPMYPTSWQHPAHRATPPLLAQAFFDFSHPNPSSRSFCYSVSSFKHGSSLSWCHLVIFQGSILGFFLIPQYLPKWCHQVPWLKISPTASDFLGHPTLQSIHSALGLLLDLSPISIADLT